MQCKKNKVKKPGSTDVVKSSIHTYTHIGINIGMNCVVLKSVAITGAHLTSLNNQLSCAMLCMYIRKKCIHGYMYECVFFNVDC